MSDAAETFFIGWTSKPVCNFADFISEPTAPSNYKNPELIAKYVADAKVKQIEEVAQIPGLASLYYVTILDEAGAERLRIEPGSRSAAVQLQEVFKNNWPVWLARRLTWPTGEVRVPDEPVFVGFEVQSFFNILALSGIREGLVMPCGLLWRDDPGLIDPYRLALASEDRKQLDISALGRLLHIPAVIHSDMSYVSAELARQLAKKLRLSF